MAPSRCCLRVMTDDQRLVLERLQRTANRVPSEAVLNAERMLRGQLLAVLPTAGPQVARKGQTPNRRPMSPKPLRSIRV